MSDLYQLSDGSEGTQPDGSGSHQTMMYGPKAHAICMPKSHEYKEGDDTFIFDVQIGQQVLIQIM